MRQQKTIQDMAYELLDAGISIIPIEPRGKKPLGHWAEYQTRYATVDEVEEWFKKWPDANIAIVCGKLSNIIVVDTDTEAGELWCRGNMTPSPIMTITLRGYHRFYRWIPNVKNYVRIIDGVDIRSDGGYVVAPPSIHPSGHVYQLQQKLGWDELEPIEIEEILGQNPQVLVSENGIDLRSVKTPATFDTEGVQGGRNNQLARLAGKYFQRGFDYHETLTMCREWNRTNCTPPLDEKELNRTVESIYKKDRLNKNSDAQAIHKSVTENTKQIPEEILNPGGILQLAIDAIEDYALVSNRWFSLGAALTLLGTVIGQKVMTTSRLRTNLYVMAIGYSGSGKNAPFEAIPKILNETEAHIVLGPNRITSDVSILETLQDQPVSLMMVDEVQTTLIQGMKNPNSHKRGIPVELNTLFSTTDTSIKKTYASREPIDVKYHHLSLYAAGVPGRFFEEISFDDVTDGFMARVFMFIDEKDAEEPDENKVRKPPPIELITQLNYLFAIKPIVTNLLDQVPEPYIISMGEDAQEYIKGWGRKYHDLGNLHKRDTTGISAIYRRAKEHALKVALIHAASEHGHKVTEERIRLNNVKWACGLIDILIQDMIMHLQSKISESDFHKKLKTLIDRIATAGTPEHPGISRSKLLRAMRIKKRDFDDIIDSAVESNLIGVTSTPKGLGRPGVWYFVINGEEL